MNGEHAMRSATIELTAFERDAATSGQPRMTASEPPTEATASRSD